ncbi:MAG: 4Fe-4S dicluster domain-containing protein [Thermoleophilia bacterium]|jgi:tetrathionate reductase subunit B
MRAFVIDLSRCTGCYCCQIACKDEHVANDWTPYAKPQPETGQFWVGIQETVRGTVPKVKVSYFPSMCLHCDDAPCLQSCPVEGAIYQRDDGLVIIDPEVCTGCKLCEDSCPYNVLFFNEGLNIAQKCTGCAHLLDAGWTVPRCVDACPTDAMRFGEVDEMADVIAKADPYRPELELVTRVHYLNIPKKFIGGTLFDPVTDEVLIGARCTLRDEANGESFTTETDGFGDFWFKDLNDDRTFTLQLEADGMSKTIEAISTSLDVNLGDIAMR